MLTSITNPPEGTRVRGAMLVYHRPPPLSGVRDASNVNENIAALFRHSRFPMIGINTGYPLPPKLAGLSFDAIVIHYSVFLHGPAPYLLGEELLELIGKSRGYKIAFFQDEHHWCGKRFAFLDEYEIDCVYTMLEQPWADQVYKTRPGVSKVVPQLPGYVGPEVIEDAERFGKADTERSVDVGYRGRPIPTYMGRGGQEKQEIGLRFAERAPADLSVEIDALETTRLYGDDWPRFLSDCRAVLGTESGVSCFDLEDEVRLAYERLSAELGREPTTDELEAEGSLARWDWKIPYRTISPRHFEAAALGVCQILYEGRYSGLMEPMRHYIPLEKDFSNFEEVIERFRDAELRAELTANARADLIDSGEYGYERFVEAFDRTLAEAGVEAETSTAVLERVSAETELSKPALVRFYIPRLAGWLWREHRVIWTVLWLITWVPWGLVRLAVRLRRSRRS